jgi:hypothetical protein
VSASPPNGSDSDAPPAEQPEDPAVQAAREAAAARAGFFVGLVCCIVSVVGSLVLLAGNDGLLAPDLGPDQRLLFITLFAFPVAFVVGSAARVGLVFSMQGTSSTPQ